LIEAFTKYNQRKREEKNHKVSPVVIIRRTRKGKKEEEEIESESSSSSSSSSDSSDSSDSDYSESEDETLATTQRAPTPTPPRRGSNTPTTTRLIRRSKPVVSTSEWSRHSSSEEEDDEEENEESEVESIPDTPPRRAVRSAKGKEKAMIIDDRVTPSPTVASYDPLSPSFNAAPESPVYDSRQRTITNLMEQLEKKEKLANDLEENFRRLEEQAIKLSEEMKALQRENMAFKEEREKEKEKEKKQETPEEKTQKLLGWDSKYIHKADLSEFSLIERDTYERLCVIEARMAMLERKGNVLDVVTKDALMSVCRDTETGYNLFLGENLDKVRTAGTRVPEPLCIRENDEGFYNFRDYIVDGAEGDMIKFVNTVIAGEDSFISMENLCVYMRLFAAVINEEIGDYYNRLRAFHSNALPAVVDEEFVMDLLRARIQGRTTRTEDALDLPIPDIY